jgi:hypothetical protein
MMRQDQRGALSALHVTGVSLLHDVKITACLVGSGTDALRCLDLHDPASHTSNGWWSQTGSNRRPPACKAGALPTELWPHQATAAVDQRSRCRGRVKSSSHRGDPSTDPVIDSRSFSGARSLEWWAWKDLNFRPHAYQARALTN